MRKTIQAVITTAGTEVPEERWYGASAVPENPVKPFGTYRLGGTSRGLTSRSPWRTVEVSINVHDEPGSYLRIDRILDKVEEAFDAILHTSGDDDESIAQAHWTSRSGDLNDDGFGTIYRTTSYTIVGKG